MPDDRAGMKDYISENDSVLDVVNQMDKDNVIDMSGDNQVQNNDDDE